MKFLIQVILAVVATFSRWEGVDATKPSIRGTDQHVDESLDHGLTWASERDVHRRAVSCDNESFGISDLLFVDGPLFVVGTVNVIDRIQELHDEYFGDEEVDTTVVSLFPPTMVCAGDTEVSDIGPPLGVTACEPIDFLSDTNVWAFGFQKTTLLEDKGFCAAVNPTTGTYAIGQTGLIPDIVVGGILYISLDAIGISTSKSLSAKSLNRLWDGTSLAEVAVPGHVMIRGTGSIGFKATEKIDCTISIDTSVLIDADLNNNGLSPVMEDGVTTPDFALLISGKASPKLKIASKEGTNEVDLSTLITGEVDVYFKSMGNLEASLQLAASINIMLQGICDQHPVLKIICDVFDGESEIEGAVRTFAKTNGSFGLMYAVSGEIGLKSDFVEDVVGWPDDGHSFDASFSLRFKGDSSLSVCANVGSNEWCWHKCSSHSDCDSNEFCHEFGMCLPRRNPGGACLENRVCLAGDYCVRGFCSECPTLDSTTGCPSGEFCTQKLNPFDDFIGYRCEPFRENGGLCSSSVACVNVCDVAVQTCVDCLRDGTGCTSNQYCDLYKCKTKLGNGSVCVENRVCSSGYCRAGKCSQCPTIDSSTGCASNQFCTLSTSGGYYCKTKLGRGSPCSSNTACSSGKCDFGFCVDCYRSGSGCSSRQYCDLGRCKTKISSGSYCVEDRVCMSGDCRMTWRGPRCK